MYEYIHDNEYDNDNDNIHDNEIICAIILNFPDI